MNGEEPTLDQPATNSASYLHRLEKSVAMLSKIAGASVFATVGSFCAVLALLPLKQTETVFVSMTDGAQIVRLLPEQIDRSTLEQYVRSTLTEYVEKRETINFVDDDERFKWVQTFTHPQWFRLFAEHMSSGNPDSPLVYYAKNELTRDGNRSIAELKRGTAKKELESLKERQTALVKDMDAQKQVCEEVRKAAGAKFAPPKSAKKGLFGKTVSLSEEDYNALCLKARSAEMGEREKDLLNRCLAHYKELDCLKEITDARQKETDAQIEKQTLEAENRSLKREVNKILSEHPEWKREQKKERERGGRSR